MANEQKRPYEPNDPNRGNTGKVGNTGTGRESDRGQHRDQGSKTNRDRSGGERQPGDTPGGTRHRDMDRDIEE